jgi:hypothetical protein
MGAACIPLPKRSSIADGDEPRFDGFFPRRIFPSNRNFQAPDRAMREAFDRRSQIRHRPAERSRRLRNVLIDQAPDARRKNVDKMS